MGLIGNGRRYESYFNLFLPCIFLLTWKYLVAKETIGALRPGNTYHIRIIALDSAGARLKVYGPAVFRTDVCLNYSLFCLEFNSLFFFLLILGLDLTVFFFWTFKGPEDTRQPKVNEGKMDQEWNNVVSAYPEPAPKADPYSGLFLFFLQNLF